LNLKNLRTFVATAEHGGLRRASARLNLSEPAASRQIDALETELGVTLFEHVGRRLRLTAEGELLVQRSRQLLSEADMLAEHARALKKGETGIVRLAATPQMIVGLLVPFLPGYRQRHPGVDVLLIEGSAARQRSRLEQGEVHLTIMPAGPGFSRRVLGPTHLLAVVHKSRPLSRGKVLEVSALADQPLLVMQREYGSRTWFDAACEIAQVRPRILMESTTPQTLIELAAIDYGIAIIPSTSAIRDPRLRILPIVYRGMAFGQWATICWNSRRFLPPYAKELVDALVSHAQRAFPGRAHVKHAPQLPKPFLPDELGATR
jgi:LysR family transcriptional regulator, cyn operon transcriptional activator